MLKFRMFVLVTTLLVGGFSGSMLVKGDCAGYETRTLKKGGSRLPTTVAEAGCAGRNLVAARPMRERDHPSVLSRRQEGKQEIERTSGRSSRSTGAASRTT